jgi:hypothetical protein
VQNVARVNTGRACANDCDAQRFAHLNWSLSEDRITKLPEFLGEQESGVEGVAALASK